MDTAGAIGLPELLIILPWLAVLGIAILVGRDANRRGMNGVAWGIGVALLCIVFLPIYLIVRKPLGAPSASLPVQVSPEAKPAVSAGSTADLTEQALFCPSCGNRLTTGARFCARCGAQIPTA
jgi:zinc ribbon protein